jgi:PST family polysaccharide transporter
LVILLHLAIGLAIAASAPLISLALSEPRLTSLVQVASLQFLFLAFGSVQQALAMRALNFKRLAWVDFTAATITALATLALALAGAGVWSLVLGNLVGTVARSASLMWRGEKVRPRFAFSGLGDRVAYGSRLAASQLSWLSNPTFSSALA